MINRLGFLGARLRSPARQVAPFLASLALLTSIPRAADEPSSLTADVAFRSLKALAGEWTGATESPNGPATAVLYRVTANGHTVMETLFPGAPHEMISMYHLDGTDLRMTHYCAAGNQPRLKLDAAHSTARELRFEFEGGTNLDPAKDGHVHAGRLRWVADNRLEADWVYYAGGRPAGTNRLFLTRKSPEP